MFRAVLLAAVLLPGVAAAQTTVCRQTYAGWPEGGVTCDSQAPLWSRSAPEAPVRPQDVPAKRCNPVDYVVGDAATCRARGVAADRKAVTDQIAAGDCDGALKAALRLGDLQFSREVREFCAK